MKDEYIGKEKNGKFSYSLAQQKFSRRDLIY